MDNKKGFAIIAIIVGIMGIGMGIYTITTVSSSFEQETSQQELRSLVLNGSPVVGSLDAPVMIIEYGDYQCPNCMRFNTQIKPLIVENYINTGKASLIFKDFVIYGQDSANAAVATHCAAEQNKYWEMHDHIYANQRTINSGWLSTDNIKRFASEIGLDIQQFNTCITTDRYNQQITSNFDEGRSLGVDGTPSFIIINDKGQSQFIRGAQPFTVFKQVIDEMLVS